MAIALCIMSIPRGSAILKWIHPTYEMIYEIKQPFKVEAEEESALINFDIITVTNPNGTVSEYANQYQFPVRCEYFFLKIETILPQT